MTMTTTTTSYPPVKVTARGARRFRAGIPWVFRTDIAAAPEGGLERGAIVRATDERGNFIGLAFWSQHSPLALRLLTRRQEQVDGGFWRERLRASIARRERLLGSGGGGASGGGEACRLVHGEADLVPGLFVDRYADGLTVQTVSEGADAREAELVEILDELLGPRLIAVRDDSGARDFEGLARHTRLAKGSGPASVEYREGPNLFAIDLIEDLKTGSFLDQRENHLRATEYARGSGLDCFSYHGGFALALARGCEQVIACDQYEPAAERARANAARNGLANVEVRCANAFDLLRQYEQEGRRFDVVVIDPPAFAKRKEGVAAAERAYKDLNLRALRLLAPEGVLITCSCSGKMTPELFGAMLQSAIEDAKRPVQIVERRGAARDHPVLAGLPETEYLKCWVLRAV